MRGHIGDTIPPAHGARDLPHQAVADRGRVGQRLRLHICHERYRGGKGRPLRQRQRHRLGGRPHERAMERRRYRQQHGATRALELGDLDGALDGRLRPRHHDLSRRIVVRDLADLAGLALGLGRSRRGRIDVETEQRRHRALAGRDGLLHRLSA